MEEIRRALRMVSGEDRYTLSKIPDGFEAHWIKVEKVSPDGYRDVMSALSKSHKVFDHHYDPKSYVLIALVLKEKEKESK